RQQERASEQQRHLRGRVEHLEQPRAARRAVGAHRCPVRRAAQHPERGQPRQGAGRTARGPRRRPTERCFHVSEPAPHGACLVPAALGSGAAHPPTSFTNACHTASKKLEPRGQNHWKGSPGTPMNGRSTQLICAPTRPNTTTQVRKTVHTCGPST